MNSPHDHSNESEGTNMNVVNKQLKYDSSLWEYEAPHYYDFTKMNTEFDPENDKYFMIDHEDEYEESKENALENIPADQSTGSIYQTPNKLSQRNSLIESENEYYSAKKYKFRETPLRVSYQNGNTPLKETQLTKIFGKRRKSLYQKKSDKVLYKRETFDMSKINKALEEVNCSVKDNQAESTIMAQPDDNDLDVTLQKDNVGSSKNIELEFKLSDEDKQKDIDDSSKVSELLFDSTKVVDDFEQTNEQKLPEFENITEDNFHEIEDKELKLSDENESKKKSHRTSYVVESPIVVQKRSISVHFDSSVTHKDETSKMIPINDNGDQTPKIDIQSKVSLKIKNRKPTPIIPSKGKNEKNLMNKDRLARFQKYIKRFSQTPNKEHDNNVQKDHENKNNKTEDKSGVLIQKIEFEEPKTCEKIMKKSKSFIRQSINRLAASRPSNVQRWTSLAEFNANYFLSARKYEPTKYSIKSFGKFSTKPKSPKLRTAQRSQSCRMPIKPVESLEDKEQPVTKTTTDGHKTLKPNFYPASLLIKKKPPTKAHTPVFYTDIRAKIYTQKHQPSEPEQKQIFRANPMPNFKKIQAQNERKRQERIKNQFIIAESKKLNSNMELSKIKDN